MIDSIFAFTEGAIELRAFPNERGKARPANLFTNDQEKIKAFIQRWDIAGYGVYFGVATRDPEAEPPGTIEKTCELPALWIDNDKTPKDDLRAALLGCYLPPSYIVDSGRGLHAYWLLDEAMDIRDVVSNDHVAVRALRDLARVFDADPAVADLARVMRLPGTHNSKHGAMHLTEVIRASDRRYSFDDLTEWLAWQRELVGEPVDPFLAAAERLGIRQPVDLSGMEPGNVHETQLRYTASAVTAGKSEDEIAAEVLAATRRAVGEAGRRWNWRKEEASIRQMIQTAQKKFGGGDNVVSLDERREKKKREKQGDKHEIILGGEMALSAWGRPIITVKGEMWTYEAGVWRNFDVELEHDLRSVIQGAVAAGNIAPTNSNLNGAYRWIFEHPKHVRKNVEWDRKRVVVGRNGTMDLTSGEIRTHSPDYFSTVKVDCVIDPAASCPAWLKFLDDNLPEGAAATVQEWFGAALIRGKRRELTKGMIIYGPSRTGKTQVTKVLRALLGGPTVTCGLRVKAMSERFGMQPLVGKRAWIADDAVGLREEMDAEAYKVIVTGEPVSVERKNRTNLEVSFDLPVMLTMNNYPIIRDDSDAVYNRTLVLPMTRQWLEEQAKPIGDQVVAEELSGVLNWALEGWRRLEKRGRFEIAKAMVTAVRDFKAQNNAFQDFVDLCINRNSEKMVLREDLRVCFNNWLKTEVQAKSEWSGKAIAQAVKNGLPGVYGDRDTAGRGRVWIGIEFTEDAMLYLNTFGETKRILSECNHGVPKAMRPEPTPVLSETEF